MDADLQQPCQITATGSYRPNTKTGFIDRRGEFAIAPRFDGGAPFREGLASVRIYKSDGNLNGYIDRTGKAVWELSR